MLMENAVQNEVGHEAWGMYSVSLSLAFIFILLSDWGINQYTTQHLASRPEKLREKLPHLLSLKLLLTATYPLLVVIIGWARGYEMLHLKYLVFAAIIWGLTKLMEFFRAIFQALQAFRLDSFASVLERILLIISVGMLLYLGFNLSEYVFVRIAVLLLCCVIFYITLGRMVGFHAPKLSVQESKGILRNSFSFAIVMFLYSMNEKIDQAMLQAFIGDKATGLYAGAYRWFEAFTTYLWIILPMFFARFAYFVHDEKEQEKLLHFGQIIAAIPLIYISCFAQFHGDQLLFLFTKSTVEEKAMILACLQVLFFACFTISIFSIFSTMLTATHHEKFVNRMIVAGILLNVGLNAYFIPIYGTIAAAWNTVANYLFLCACYVLYTHFRTNIRVPYGQTLRLFLLGALCYLTFIFFQHFGLLWWQESFIIGILYLIAAFILRLIPSPKELKLLMKK